MENDARGRKFPEEGVYRAAEQRIVSELSPAQLSLVSALGAQISANWHETPSLQLPKHPSVDTRPRAPQGKRSSLQSRRWLPAAAVTRHSGIISRVRTDAFK